MVIGYSIKSIGIADDLGISDFVLSIEHITEYDAIKKRFIDLERSYHNDKISDYIKKVMDIKKII
jgi:polysaccharide pyruvyl transferase WcaK-like protein